MQHLWTLLALIILNGCGGTPKNTENPTPDPSTKAGELQTLFVDAKRVDCEGAHPQKCYLIKEKEAEEWRYLYAPIRGFRYQEGFVYKIQVRVTKIDQPAPDQHPLVYNLEKVLSKEPAQEDPALAGGLTKVVYEAYTRGRFLRLEVDSKEARYYQAREDAYPTRQATSANSWKTLNTTIQELDLPALATLTPPSNRRATDGALAAQVTVVNQEGEFVSSIFDHKNPPKALEPLAQQLLSILEEMD